MPRRKWNDGLRLMGRPRTAPRLSWSKTIEAYKLPDVPDGMLCDVTPAPGRSYTRYTWPPRGRGRGESLLSPRRIEAKLRTIEVIRLRRAGYTWQAIARALGYADASGPYRAYKRTIDRIDWDRAQKQKQK
jgi:hypothetical protein